MLRVSPFALIVCLACLLGILFWKANAKSCSVEGNICTNFDGHGFPYNRLFRAPAEKEAVLTLAAAGMRRKKLFVLEVDVYSVAIYLSETKLQSAKEKSLNFVSSTPNSEEISSGIVLHFVRDVPTNKVVDAIVEALLSTPNTGESYSQAVNSLQSLLLSAIGESGMKKGDEIEFSFYGSTNTAISVAVRGQMVGSVENRELRERLGEIYTGKQAVAPKVHEILSQYYD